MINFFRRWFSYRIEEAPRSPLWPRVRKIHLLANPACAACATGKKLEVHHIVPYHHDPARELEPGNLLTLCERCHFLFGHFDNWLDVNPNAREDAAAWLAKMRPQCILPPPLQPLPRRTAMSENQVTQASTTSTDFYPLPAALPLAEIKCLLGYVKGQTVAPAVAAHAALNVVGFGLSQWATAPAKPVLPEPAHGQIPERPLEAGLAAVVYTAEAQNAPAPLAAVDWRLLARQVLDLLLNELLKKVIGG